MRIIDTTGFASHSGPCMKYLDYTHNIFNLIYWKSLADNLSVTIFLELTGVLIEDSINKIELGEISHLFHRVIYRLQ